MAASVLLDGSVYSPADPFATALVMNEGQVEWVGQDAGARSIADSSMTVQELGGSLVTPSFALAAASVTGADA
ncbi:MAG: amidohydrolase, partial [Rothia sp. (in: high G+C Gram-positive bacteria)]|nr:amidohydrolase [Rothia sp. (in: high G+C Gram-positive bacteria)]